VSTLQDDLISLQITAARELVESYTGRQLVTATFKLTLDAFPCLIRLPRPPLQAVTTVKYYDTDGVLQTVDAADYQVDATAMPGTLSPAYGVSWPASRWQPAAVEIVYTAGFGATAASVPAMLRQAILLTVAHWYTNREAVITGTIASELPLGVQRILSLNWHGRLNASG
jgi:uncharacterized phiE125 gp8 family phage protein